MDDLGIYDDLDDFHEEEQRKSKELLELEAKYNETLKTIEVMKLEKKDLRKKIRIMEQNLQSLLDTAKAEIKRKDKLIEDLRKEKDDICFRRQRLHPVRKFAQAEVIEKQFSTSQQKIDTEEIKLGGNRCIIEDNSEIVNKLAKLEENTNRLDLKTKDEKSSKPRDDQRHTSSHHRRKDDEYSRKKDEHRCREDDKSSERRSSHHKSRKRSCSPPNKNEKDFRKIEKKEKDDKRKYDRDEKQSSRNRYDNKDHRKREKKYEARDRDKSSSKVYESPRDRKRRRSSERDNKERKPGSRTKEENSTKSINFLETSNSVKTNKLEFENIESSDDEVRFEEDLSKKLNETEKSIGKASDNVKKIEELESEEKIENNGNDTARKGDNSSNDHVEKELKTEDMKTSKEIVNEKIEKVIYAAEAESQNLENECDTKSEELSLRDSKTFSKSLNTPTKVALYDAVFGVAGVTKSTNNSFLLENIKDIFKHKSPTEILENNEEKCKIENSKDITKEKIRDSLKNKLAKEEDIKSSFTEAENFKNSIELDDIANGVESSLRNNENQVSLNSMVSVENCFISGLERISELENISDEVVNSSTKVKDVFEMNAGARDVENFVIPGLNKSMSGGESSIETLDTSSETKANKEKSVKGEEINEKRKKMKDTSPVAKLNLNTPIFATENCFVPGLKESLNVEKLSNEDISSKETSLKGEEINKKSKNLVGFSKEIADTSSVIKSNLNPEAFVAENCVLPGLKESMDVVRISDETTNILSVIKASKERVLKGEEYQDVVLHSNEALDTSLVTVTCKNQGLKEEEMDGKSKDVVEHSNKIGDSSSLTKLNPNTVIPDVENCVIPSLNKSSVTITCKDQNFKEEEIKFKTNKNQSSHQSLNIKLDNAQNCDAYCLEKSTELKNISKTDSMEKDPITTTTKESSLIDLEKNLIPSIPNLDLNREENCSLPKVDHVSNEIVYRSLTSSSMELQTKELSDKNTQDKEEDWKFTSFSSVSSSEKSLEIRDLKHNEETFSLEQKVQENKDEKLLSSLKKKIQTIEDSFESFSTSEAETNKMMMSSQKSDDNLKMESVATEIKLDEMTTNNNKDNNQEKSEDKEKDNSFFSLTLSSDEDDDDDDANIFEDVNLQTEELKQMKEKIEIIENIRLPMLFQLKPKTKNSPRKEREKEKLKRKGLNEKSEKKLKKTENQIRSGESIPVVDESEENVLDINKCHKDQIGKDEDIIVPQIINDTTMSSFPNTSTNSSSIQLINSIEQIKGSKKTKNNKKLKTEKAKEIFIISDNSNSSHSTASSTKCLQTVNTKNLVEDSNYSLDNNLSNDTDSEIAFKQLRSLESSVQSHIYKKKYGSKIHTSSSSTSVSKVKSFIKLDLPRNNKNRERRCPSEQPNDLKGGIGKEPKKLPVINQSEVKVVLKTSTLHPSKDKRSPLKPQKSDSTNKLLKSPKKKNSLSCQKNQKRKFSNQKSLEEPQVKHAKLVNTSAEVRAMLIDGKSPKISNDLILSSSLNITPDTNLDELDRDMQAIFQSPIKIDNNFTTSDCDPKANSTKLDETNVNDGDSPIVSSNVSVASDCSLDSKCLSLGSSQYIVERISENVVNLFVTRRRSKKRGNKSIVSQVDGSTIK